MAGPAWGASGPSGKLAREESWGVGAAMRAASGSAPDHKTKVSGDEGDRTKSGK
jgi:hypothetical protein